MLTLRSLLLLVLGLLVSGAAAAQTPAAPAGTPAKPAIPPAKSKVPRTNLRGTTTAPADTTQR